MPPTPTSDPPAHSVGGRSYLGLALLGWGLAIVLGVTPHEDRVVGASLAVFGAVLVASSRGLPRLPPLPPLWVAGAGLSLAACVLAYVLAADAPLDVRKIALIAVGSCLAAAAPWLERVVPVARRGVTATVGSLAGCALVVLGAPLAVWALQAVFKALVGATPLEAFVRVGLLAPLHLLLAMLGHPSVVEGQTVSYATREGVLHVNVGAACSGLQAMGLFSGVLALYMFVERPGGMRLAIWSAIGLAGVYVANLLRLVAIFLVGYQWGHDALVRVHAQAGWVFFLAWALLFARLVPKVAR